jgi:hypothetical protein
MSDILRYISKIHSRRTHDLGGEAPAQGCDRPKMNSRDYELLGA